MQKLLKQRNKTSKYRAKEAFKELDDKVEGANDDEVIIERDETSTSTNDYKSNSGDDLYDQAVALVARERKASTSFIQRHLKIGYNRAATIIEKMETEGVVSSSNHVGKREVLIDDHSV